MTFDHNKHYRFESLVSAILRLFRPTDIQLKLVPETLVLNPLDLHDVKVGHRLTKQRLHLFVFFGRILQQNFLPETEENGLNLPLRTVKTTQKVYIMRLVFLITF